MPDDIIPAADLPDEDDHESFTAGDVDPDTIDWDQVTDLQARYDAVNAIVDDDERLAAARALVAEMGGG